MEYITNRSMNMYLLTSTVQYNHQSLGQEFHVMIQDARSMQQDPLRASQLRTFST